uniref:hypothetical protein n=1 Tax=Orientia tsutsugamushi TaxID=784 RepID=UPI000A4304AE
NTAIVGVLENNFFTNYPKIFMQKVENRLKNFLCQTYINLHTDTICLRGPMLPIVFLTFIYHFYNYESSITYFFIDIPEQKSRIH